MFAGFGGLDRPLGVNGMRRGDVDRVNFAIRQQIGVAGVSLRGAVFRAEFLGGFAGAAGDGEKPARFGLGQPLSEDARDPAG